MELSEERNQVAGSVRVMVRVRSSIARTPSADTGRSPALTAAAFSMMNARYAIGAALSGSTMVRNEYSKSLAVTGRPSDQVRPERRMNV